MVEVLSRHGQPVLSVGQIPEGLAHIGIPYLRALVHPFLDIIRTFLTRERSIVLHRETLKGPTVEIARLERGIADVFCAIQGIIR